MATLREVAYLWPGINLDCDTMPTCQLTRSTSRSRRNFSLWIPALALLSSEKLRQVAYHFETMILQCLRGRRFAYRSPGKLQTLILVRPQHSPQNSLSRHLWLCGGKSSQYIHPRREWWSLVATSRQASYRPSRSSIWVKDVSPWSTWTLTQKPIRV